MNRISEIFKKHYIPIIGAAALLIIIIAVTLSVCNRPKTDDSAWGKSEITAGIPAFGEKEAEIKIGENYIAAYYKNVSGERIAEYESLLAEKLGIIMPPSTYPCTAVYDGRIITLHYNVTEMNFSVTVTKTENTEENSEK